ncbi:MAG: hypothetical protein ABMA25_06055 [Ilumatobacteraceae bacterium]
MIVDLRLDEGEFGSQAELQRVFDLEDQLIEAISAAGVGEYDGNEFGAGGATLYAYGPDADALFAVMEGPLRDFGADPGSSATIRHGGPDSDDVRVVPLA